MVDGQGAEEIQNKLTDTQPEVVMANGMEKSRLHSYLTDMEQC